MATAFELSEPKHATIKPGKLLIGGLWVWIRTTLRVWRGFEVTLSVELCTTYWHALLLIWIVLFGLLLST